jgi:hypothetical protein
MRLQAGRRGPVAAQTSRNGLAQPCGPGPAEGLAGRYPSGFARLRPGWLKTACMPCGGRGRTFESCRAHPPQGPFATFVGTSRCRGSTGRRFNMLGTCSARQVVAALAANAVGVENPRLQRARRRGSGSYGASPVPGGLPGWHVVPRGGPDGSSDDHEHREPEERYSHGIGNCQGPLRGNPRGDLRRDVDGRRTARDTVNGPGSKRQQRDATATGEVTFDGVVLVDGPNNHPLRPTFIRVDTEK